MNLRTIVDEGSVFWRDVWSDRAGLWPRLALSAVLALGVTSIMLAALGVIELNANLRDEHIAFALGLAGSAWCAMLVVVWMRYRKFARLIIGGLLIIATWVLVAAVCVLISAMTYREELLIAATIFLGLTTTGIIALLTLYGLGRGKPVRSAAGSVLVQCPACGYDLTGLSSCRCPECGEQFTINELIAAQGYDGAKVIAPASRNPAAAGHQAPQLT